jgi:hypothetical protein
MTTMVIMMMVMNVSTHRPFDSHFVLLVGWRVTESNITMMSVEQSVGCLTGDTVPQYHFVHHKSHMT